MTDCPDVQRGVRPGDRRSMTDRPSFHDLLARYVARHACEVHAETAGCPHLTPTWDDAADFQTSLTAHGRC